MGDVVTTRSRLQTHILTFVGVALVGGAALVLVRSVSPNLVSLDAGFTNGSSSTRDILFGYQTPTYATYATSSTQNVYDESTVFGQEHAERAKRIRPQVVRFPDGTPANFYNWETETFPTLGIEDKDCNVNNRSGSCQAECGMSNLGDTTCMQARQTEFLSFFNQVAAKPVFVLNVQEKGLLKNADGSPYLMNWVNAMNSGAYAIKVKWWELGNEIFWAKPMGWVQVTTANDPRCAGAVLGSRPVYECEHIARARDYITVSGPVGRAILSDATYRNDPQFRVMATMMGPHTVKYNVSANAIQAAKDIMLRSDVWDKEVKKSAIENYYNAVAVHTYFGDERAGSSDNTKWFMQAGDEYPIDLANWASAHMPQGMPIQQTEFGISVPGSWEPYWAYIFGEYNAILQLLTHHRDDAKNFYVEALYKHFFCYAPSPGTSREYAQGNLAAMTCAKEAPGWANHKRLDGTNATGELHTFLLDALNEATSSTRIEKRNITGIEAGIDDIVGIGRNTGKSYSGAVVFRFLVSTSGRTRHIVLNRQSNAFKMSLPSTSNMEYELVTYNGKADDGQNGLATTNRAMIRTACTKDMTTPCSKESASEIDVPGNSVVLILGTPTSITTTLGDVDGDGAILARDALMTLRLAGGQIIPGANTTAADVNCDGIVSAADALIILKAAVGSIPQPLTCASGASAGVGDAKVQRSGNGTGTIDTATPVKSGASYTLSYTAKPDAHSTFTGWSGDCTGASVCRVTITPTTKANITATFSQSAQRSDIALFGGNDLRITPSKPTVGRAISITPKLKNLGTLPTGSFITSLRIDEDGDGVWDFADVERTTAIRPNQTRATRFRKTFTPFVTGTHTIQVCADDGALSDATTIPDPIPSFQQGTELELTEDNNCQTTTITVGAARGRVAAATTALATATLLVGVPLGMYYLVKNRTKVNVK